MTQTPSSRWPVPPGGTWIVDLDGVVWLAEQPIPGSAEAVKRLRDADVRVVFVTNNALPTTQELIDRLARAGVDVEADDIVSSAQAAAQLVKPTESVFVCAGAGMVEALHTRGATVVDEGPADAVIVGLTHEFDFELLARTMAVVRGGARFIGTNEDPTHPTPKGLLPGSGAIVAAVATASQVTPQWAGKPHEPLARLVRERCPDVTLVVGDRPATDGLFAQLLGVPFGLVLSGVTSAGHEPFDLPVDIEAPDLATLAGIAIDAMTASS